MGTFDSKVIVDQIIARDGYDPDDTTSRFVKIVEYTTMEGNQVYGAVLDAEYRLGLGRRYEIPTEYVRNPKVIWRADGY